ncbi:Procollagen-lysine 5-dioxygenase [Aphelenchoides besseyi]|nr:Procollagen-lysine 5-dioxygenase [Aphelenchoides besseyi]KAI6211340.1 Procollagen-lysine 5-dioxygenase [Aphelenchoides besseyi]
MLKLLLFLLLTQVTSWQKSWTADELHVVTVATEETDGFRRLKRSADEFGHRLHVFGMGVEWNGGDMQTEGGGQKIRLLREGLDKLSETGTVTDKSLIMFVDAYDVILNADAKEIIRRYRHDFVDLQKTQILFGAEPFCWPDVNLVNSYPPVTFGERYLNSGLFIGPFSRIRALLREHAKGVKDSDDDQLFYTRLYLDEKIRNDFGLTLDSLSRIFQNLNGLQEKVHVEADDIDGSAKVFNSLYNTHPVVIHGNGPSKLQLNSFGNYIANQFNMITGCQHCDPLVKMSDELPQISVAIFNAKPTPYFEEFLQTFLSLDYPKDRIHLYVYNNQPYNREEVEKFADEHTTKYHSVEVMNVVKEVDERRGRTDAIDHALKLGTEYYLSIDADAHLNSTQTIRQLIRRIRTYDLGILSPMVNQPGRLFSNFWGAVSPKTGFYERSADYIPIAERQRRGYWNMPFVNSVYMIRKEKLAALREAFWFDKDIDADMSFAKYCRHFGHFMYVDNQEQYGFLVESDFFGELTPQTIHRELYDYPNNKALWESRYIHPKYRHYLEPDTAVPMVCPDVYDFPFISERFASEMIQVMENYGKWSNGKNEDERLAGGYENVPTRDIHMNQIGMHGQFLQIIDDYVAPMQEKLFYGYYQRPIKSDMMFVVRYKPEEQASLRPHLDASTYSIDVALNKRGVDYEGGGVRYVRYNCTVPADEVGWSMLFPGRLTHLHEGLPTTKGTRYILVSFINP